MRTTLNIFVAISIVGGIFLTIGTVDEKTSSLGAAAGGLFVCLGLCLYSLTKLEIAEKKAARDEQRQKES